MSTENRADGTMPDLGRAVAAADDAEIGRAVRALLPSSRDPRDLVVQLVGWLRAASGETENPK